MSFIRAFSTIGGLTLASRVAGFVRDMLTASLLGAGPVADAVVVAQRLPNLFRSLFAEGAFNTAFVPLYTAERARQGEESARSFITEVWGAMILVLTIFSVLMVLFMPWVIRVIAPGFADEADRFALSVSLGRIAFPYLVLISLVALLSGVLNAHGRFAAPAIAPILFNICMILAVLGAILLGGAPELWLTCGLTASGAVQLAWLLWVVWRLKLSFRWSWPRWTPRLRHLAKQIAPSALGAGAIQINVLVSTILASLLPAGIVSALYYADRLAQLPMGVIGIAAGTAMLPLLSGHLARGDEHAASHLANRGMEASLFLALPAAGGLIAAAEPIVRVLFERGAFTAADTAATSAALAAYALGMPAAVLVRLLAANAFARQDTRLPVRCALFAVVANMVLAALLLPVLQHVGIALASSLAAWLNAGLLAHRVWGRGWLRPDARLRKNGVVLTAATFVMSGLVYGAACGARPFLLPSSGLLVQAAILTALLAAGGATYLLITWRAGAFSLADLRRWRKR
ncbi:MAG: murein biosynthesis integral membrane protein MurJ [Alphaproteobacteria bacterium]|nr:MAG: murein biosynthesis integral membrane protein MurJ [Alphaproteobacteria bacterium]